MTQYVISEGNTTVIQLYTPNKVVKDIFERFTAKIKP